MSATAAIALLRRWIAQVASPEAVAWLDAAIARQQTGVDERALGIALGLAGRKLGRADLQLAPEELAAAQRMRPGWQPQLWTADEAARAALLMATHHGDDAAFAARVDRLCATAEIAEHIAYLKAFAIFPAGAALQGRAREGVRSSIAAVFQAIACHNPYPRDHFDEAAWNQMVVKCVFVGAPIETVVGLVERRNGELIQMLRDFVAERHAAGRPLPEAVHRFIAG
jgi:hypothetical protein